MRVFFSNSISFLFVNNKCQKSGIILLFYVSI